MRTSCRLFHKAAGNATNCLRHGCREQSGLMTFRDLRGDGSTSSMKPMRSISSASSRTRPLSFEVQSATFQVVQQTARSTDNDLLAPDAGRVIARHNAGRRTGQPRLRRAYVLEKSVNCFSNLYGRSRVGASTRICGAFSSGSRFCSRGKENAAVFPLPVWAIPRTSRPFSRCGIHSA